MEERRSILDGITEHDVVHVHNPLSTEFVGRVARSVVVSHKPKPPTLTGNAAADAFMNGINMSIINGGKQAIETAQQIIPFKPGQTLKLPGDAAIVIVRQIVNEMMQRQGAKKRMADPFARMEFERQVVLNHESMLKYMTLESAQEKLQRQLDELNKTEDVQEEVTSEPEFPTQRLNESAGGFARTDGGDGQADSKASATGRRKKK